MCSWKQALDYSAASDIHVMISPEVAVKDLGRTTKLLSVSTSCSQRQNAPVAEVSLINPAVLIILTDNLNEF